MKQWFVAHTQPSKEALAELELSQQGFEVYLPRYQKVRRHARKIDTVLAPLFPRYLFLAFDLTFDQWRSVNGTRGISYLLMNTDLPISVPDLIIKKLKANEDREGNLPLSSLVLFAKGDKVRIAEGTLEGQVASFEKLDSCQRVQLLLNFLGRETKVSLPIYAVDVA